MKMKKIIYILQKRNYLIKLEELVNKVLKNYEYMQVILILINNIKNIQQ